MSRWVFVGWYFTALKDEQTHNPMEEHTKSLQHTQAQLWPFIMVCWTLMLTVNPTRSNLLSSLDTVAAAALDNTMHTYTVCVCVWLYVCVCVLHLSVHPCVPPRASMRSYMQCVLTCPEVDVCMCGHTHVCAWTVVFIKLCPGQICVLYCLYLSICCVRVCVCVCVFCGVRSVGVQWEKCVIREEILWSLLTAAFSQVKHQHCWRITEAEAL